MRCSSVQGPHNEDENPHMTTWLHVRIHLVAGHSRYSGCPTSLLEVSPDMIKTSNRLLYARF